MARRPSADGGWGVSAAASPPVGSPPQYSPALRWVTTGFGMGPGGASTLSATGTPHPPRGRPGALVLVYVALAVSCQAAGRPRRSATPATGSPLPGPVRSPARPVPHHLGFVCPSLRRGPVRGLPSLWRAPPHCRVTTPVGSIAGSPPSTIRTARLQSVARGPPAAYQPGHLPGVLPQKEWGCSSWGGIPA
jgi:hypothetical protein